MKNFFRAYSNILIILFFIIPIFANAVGDSVQVELHIIGCNNNGICEPGAGEDNTTCPLDCPLPPDPPDPPDPSDPEDGGGSQSGYRIQLNIFNISTFVNPQTRKVFINWDTNTPARSVLYWGRNQDYRIATYSGIGFVKDHFTVIENLTEGQYNFLIEARDIYGNLKFSEVGTFYFAEVVPDTPPDNPTNFRTFTTQEGIGLAWTNPTNLDFSRVRLVRGEKGYPQSHLDGRVIYEGGGQSVVDYNVVEGRYYYYSIFAIDDSGQVSSGSVLKAKYLSDEGGGISEDVHFDTTPDPVPDPDSDVVSPPTLTLDDYKFTQHNQELEKADNVFIVDGEKSFEISINKNKIPTNHDVIAYFNTNSNNKISSGYKFSYIEDENIFRVIVPSLRVEGEIFFVLRTVNSYGEVVTENNGVILSFLSPKQPDPDKIYGEVIPSFILWVIIGLLIYFFLFFISKSRRKRA